MRVAGLHREPLGDAVVRIGEQDLLGPLLVDVHAGCDQVELTGLQPADELAELDHLGVDVVDAQLGEHGLGDVGGDPGGFAVVADEAERDLVGDADGDRSVALELLEQTGARLRPLVRVGSDVLGGQGVRLLDVGLREVLVTGDDLGGGAVLTEGVELLVERLVEVAVLETEAVATAGQDLLAVGVDREEGLDRLDGTATATFVGRGVGAITSCCDVVVIVAAGGDEQRHGGEDCDQARGARRFGQCSGRHELSRIELYNRFSTETCTPPPRPRHPEGRSATAERRTQTPCDGLRASGRFYHLVIGMARVPAQCPAHALRVDARAPPKARRRVGGLPG